jgi:U-box domain
MSASQQATVTATVVPLEYLCSLTKSLMADPLVSKTGYSFERDAILAWVSKKGTCPVTGKPLVQHELVSNHALRIKIQFWCKNNGIEWKRSVNEEEEEEEEEDVSSDLFTHAMDSMTLKATDMRKGAASKGIDSTYMSLKDVAFLSLPAPTAGEAVTAATSKEASLQWNRQRLSAQISNALAGLS